MARKPKQLTIARDPMRYLKARGAKWHYVRRVPAHFAHIDGRGIIQISLKTSSLDVAQLRRDSLERADELLWQGLSLEHPDSGAQARYQATKARAVALGFEYKAVADLAESGDAAEILRRISLGGVSPNRDRTALLGIDDLPELTVRRAMDSYLDEIGKDETRGMSPAQKANWRKVKLTAVDRFVEAVSDKLLLEITRADAIKFHGWWMRRIENEGVSGNTANRRFGDLRKLFREYTRFHALDLKNPFDGLSFSNPKALRLKVKPFDAAFVEKKFLSAGALHKLNREAKLILLAMIETGCRPSEICNLRPEQIHLDVPVPYLEIVYRPDRKVKTQNSVRDIPLVGVSLEAMKRAPKGFPRYADKETNFSAVIMKHLKDRKLLPSKHHRAYSIRHTYEKRMLEAGFDDEFRRRILGHDTDRPEYGDGGALSWRRDKMVAIALKYDASILT